MTTNILLNGQPILVRTFHVCACSGEHGQDDVPVRCLIKGGYESSEIISGGRVVATEDYDGDMIWRERRVMPDLAYREMFVVGAE